jgi:surface antigen
MRISAGAPASFRLLLACQLLVYCALAGCSSTTSYDQIGQKQEHGEELGSVVGDIIGNYIPGGRSVAGQVLKDHAGTIGGLVGGAIGAALDEEDRQALDKATREAFESGQTRSFANKRTGARGTVAVVKTHVNQNGQQCRTLKQDIKTKSGAALTDNVSACKGADGWKA